MQKIILIENEILSHYRVVTGVDLQKALELAIIPPSQIWYAVIWYGRCSIGDKGPDYSFLTRKDIKDLDNDDPKGLLGQLHVPKGSTSHMAERNDLFLKWSRCREISGRILYGQQFLNTFEKPVRADIERAMKKLRDELKITRIQAPREVVSSPKEIEATMKRLGLK